MGKESGGDSAEVLGEAFFKERKAELEQRVSKKRFTHVMGVVEEAEILARAYGVDVREARLAGLLHDWDKAYDDEEIRERRAFCTVRLPPLRSGGSTPLFPQTSCRQSSATPRARSI